MNFFFLPFAFLPSLIWLSYYLRKDVRPEPKIKVLKIFIFGFFVAFLAAFFEVLILEFFGLFQLPFSEFLKLFLAVALVEEFFKFLVIFFFVFGDPEFDEKIDSMVYMIICALGFAAAENLLIFLRIFSPFEAFGISILRFFGATFLHALCSAILGYFLAIYYFINRKKMEILKGIFLATFFHGLYNFSIVSIKESWHFIFPAFLILSLAALVSILFQRLQQ